MHKVEYKNWILQKVFNDYNEAVIFQNYLVDNWDITAKII